MPAARSPAAAAAQPQGLLRPRSAALALAPCAAAAARCLGPVDVTNGGYTTLVKAQWNTPGEPAGEVEVLPGGAVSAGLRGRAYFAEECFEGDSLYNRSQYQAMRLLGKSVRYTVDLAGAGCGCNVAVYLASMRQNVEATQCMDHYCDANAVCGEKCAEIDLMEANAMAIRSTLHSAEDSEGVAVGLGPELGHWSPSEYGPSGSCINTSMPFSVQVAFPVDEDGKLASMQVTLFQPGSTCPLHAGVTSYSFMGKDRLQELSRELESGMTLILSYWSSDSMAWLDGSTPADGALCQEELSEECPAAVRLSNFSLQDIHLEEGERHDSVAAPGRCDCVAGGDPVCGVDGKTYDSACRARCAGAVVYSEGRCQEPVDPTGDSTTWVPLAAKPIEMCDTASYKAEEEAFLAGLFAAGTSGCKGAGECQFRTLEDAQVFCNGQLACTGVLQHPLGGRCQGGYGCFTPRSGEPAASPPLFHKLGGRCWVLHRGREECAGGREAARRYVFAGYLNASEAQDACAEVGGLALNRAEDLPALQEALAAALDARKLETEGRQSAVWLGGRWNGAAGRWEREDGAEISQINWADGQPSAKGDQTKRPWLRMDLGGKVYDADPKELFGTMCERGLRAAPPTAPAAAASASQGGGGSGAKAAELRRAAEAGGAPSAAAAPGRARLPTARAV